MIAKISALLREKKVSSVELTKQYLDAIEKENDTLRAYITVTPELALEAARRSDERRAASNELGALDGVPMALKDNLSTRGVATTCASHILEGYVPIYDATVWTLLKEQGAVLLGKANMDEFAMGSACDTSYYGGAVNPHNTEYVAGGSSGGAAAAVAGGLAAYSIGSDTGGSIRQPASFCGLVGLKPTYGAVSRYGLIAYASSFDQIGPITSDVTDAALVLDAISKRDALDSTSQGREPVSGKLDGGAAGLKIGVASEYFDGLDSGVANALEAAIKTYEKMGARISRFSMPALDGALAVYYILACAEAASNLGRYDGIRYGLRAGDYIGVDEMICKTRSYGFGAEVKRRIMLGNYVLSSGYYDAYYKKAQNLRGRIVESFKNEFEKYDVILAPTVPVTAFSCGRTKLSPTQDYLADVCTVPVNIAGLCAVSVPCGQDAAGLPVGMQLIGPRFGESTILRAALAFERESAGAFNISSGRGVLL